MSGTTGHNRQGTPYVMSGAGGYGISQREEVAKAYMQKIGIPKDGSNALGSVIFGLGDTRATVTKPATGNATLAFEYLGVKPKSSGPDDRCTVDLAAGKLVP